MWRIYIASMVAVTLCSSCDSDGNTSTEAASGLVIGMQPVSERLQSFEATSVSSDIVEARARLTMAFADGYPREFAVEVDEGIDAFGIDCGYLVGEIDLASVVVLDDSAVSVTLEDQRLIMHARAVGTGVLAVKGTFVPGPYSCNLAPGVELPLSLRLQVDVVEPRGTEFELAGCDPMAPLVATSQQVKYSEGVGWDFRPVLKDVHGVPFHAANASELAQATVVLSQGYSQDQSEPPVTLSQWQAPDVAGIVDITPPWGAPIAVEVVDAKQISAYEVSYQVPGEGLRTTESIEEDQVFDFNENWSSQALVAVVFESMDVGGRDVCVARPPLSWFDLRSRTPDVCVVEPSGDDAVLPVWGEALDQVARLVRDGTCILELEGPAGMTQTFAATFLGLDG